MAKHARPSKMRRAARIARSAALPGIGVASLAVTPTMHATPPVHPAVLSAPMAARTLEHSPVSDDTTSAVPAAYKVRPGDTLTKIAQDACGNPADWTGIYSANKAKIANPNMIFSGQQLTLDCRRVRGVTAPPANQQVPSGRTELAGSTYVSGGIFSFTGLERLWEEAGGPSWAAPEMATIALRCESGGDAGNYYGRAEGVPYQGDSVQASGLWQILGQVVPGNIFNPLVNAENAVKKFHDAGGFSPWRGDGCV